LVNGVERAWESDELFDDFSFLRRHGWEWSEDGTEEESLDLGFGHTGELVLFGDPGVLLGVDFSDLIGSTDVGTVRDSNKCYEK